MQRGFSLVELSIVLVILGLLTGGILAGQSLIRAAELRAISTEFNRYVTATQAFRDKYFALPGDMRNATSFWLAQNPTPATCAVTPSSAAATCDGNGNGQIEYTAASSNEMYRFWQHLANAGLIEGTYNGTSGTPSPAGFMCTLGTNCPRSKVSNAGWTVLYLGRTVGHGQWFDANYDNALFFGSTNSGTSYTASAAISPEEAWNIDTKVDDGRATTGKALAWKNLITNGCTDSDLSTANYVLTTKTNVCALIFAGAI